MAAICLRGVLDGNVSCVAAGAVAAGAVAAADADDAAADDAAAADDDEAGVLLLILVLFSVGGCESADRCPTPGMGVELRPLAGLLVDDALATITSSGFSTDFPTDVDVRFDVGCASAATPAELA